MVLRPPALRGTVPTGPFLGTRGSSLTASAHFLSLTPSPTFWGGPSPSPHCLPSSLQARQHSPAASPPHFQHGRSVQSLWVSQTTGHLIHLPPTPGQTLALASALFTLDKQVCGRRGTGRNGQGSNVAGDGAQRPRIRVRSGRRTQRFLM